jgi:hypothetical protein
MAQAADFSVQLYILEDHARSLFPLTTTKGPRNNKYYRFSGAARWCSSSHRETCAA